MKEVFGRVLGRQVTLFAASMRGLDTSANHYVWASDINECITAVTWCCCTSVSVAMLGESCSRPKIDHLGRHILLHFRASLQLEGRNNFDSTRSLRRRNLLVLRAPLLTLWWTIMRAVMILHHRFNRDLILLFGFLIADVALICPVGD